MNNIQTMWLDLDNGIRYWKFDAQWTWDEFYQHLQADIEQTPISKKPFDVILDFTCTRELPPHFLTQMRVSSIRANDNLDTIVFVGNRVVHALMDSFHLLNHRFLNRYSFADTLEQAMSIVRRHQHADLN
ncbi:MAG: hypothetical protein U0694_29340 [Anaerolineae bacterium]